MIGLFLKVWSGPWTYFAIDRVSIHSKLRLEDVEDATAPEKLESARNALTTFLGKLSELIHKAEESEDKIAFGAHPRLSSLARNISQSAESRYSSGGVPGGGPERAKGAAGGG